MKKNRKVTTMAVGVDARISEQYRVINSRPRHIYYRVPGETRLRHMFKFLPDTYIILRRDLDYLDKLVFMSMHAAKFKESLYYKRLKIVYYVK